MRRIAFFSLYLLTSLRISLIAQTVDSIAWRKPLDLPIDLSGNFGELRSNHFHGGVDFRTESVVNKKVYAVYDGYVSRVSISPVGYGKALYITHPGGYVSVCAHLNAFSPTIDKIIRSSQMSNESFEIDTTFLPHELPVKKGDWIALTGNTGSSGGPHLHFELRNNFDHQLDFLNYIPREYSDTISPRFLGLSVYNFTDQGALYPPIRTQLYSIEKSKHSFSFDRPLRLWGKIAFGVRALDYVNRSNFNFGVKMVEFYVDSLCIFRSTMNKIPYTETRMMNSFVDYDTWYTKRLFYQKSYVEPGNVFPRIQSINNGVLEISELRVYSCLYRLTDDVGNVSQFTFDVIGDPSQKVAFPEITHGSSSLFNWVDNKIMHKDIIVQIPKESFFTNIHFDYSARSSSKFLTPIHSLHKPNVPLRSAINLSLKIPKPLIANSNQYVLAFMDAKGNVRYSAAEIQDGWMNAQVRQLGDYAVSIDTVAPSISPLGEKKWGQRAFIRFKITDSQTRIKSYKGFIDGNFVLFEYDAKSKTIFCDLSKERVLRNRTHALRLVVADECLNYSEASHTFFY